MAVYHSSRAKHRPARSLPGANSPRRAQHRQGKKRSDTCLPPVDIDALMGCIFDALAVVETAQRALDAVEEDPGISIAITPQLITLRQGVAALRHACYALDEANRALQGV